jgi:hypothetical protein
MKKRCCNASGKPTFRKKKSAQQIAQGDCLPLRFLKLFAPAVLVLAWWSLCWPGSALAQPLGG